MDEQKKAIADAYQEGWKAGHEEGSDEGFNFGFEKGEEEGFEAGFSRASYILNNREESCGFSFNYDCWKNGIDLEVEREVYLKDFGEAHWVNQPRDAKGRFAVKKIVG